MNEPVFQQLTERNVIRTGQLHHWQLFQRRQILRFVDAALSFNSLFEFSKPGDTH
jgi:hypothetical protein